MARGEIFILSAPSGTGKTTLIQALMEGALSTFGGLVFSVSHTSRPPRSGEVPGKDYHFVDEPTFQRMIAEERFLEWAEVHGQLKGTAKDEVYPRLERGIDVLMDIDVQGGLSVMERHPEAHTIFIMPPSYEELERRLRGRGLDEPGQIARRLSVSLWEIERYNRYQYVIFNDDLKRASQVLAAIILDKRHRLERMSGRARQVLEGFRDR